MSYFHNSSYQLYLAPSHIPKAGNGVFTRETIPTGSIIDEYTGTVCSSKRGGGYAFEVREDYIIDARDFPRCYMAMLNDCSYIARSKIRRKKRWVDTTPDGYYDTEGNRLFVNCKFVGTGDRVFVQATADIYAGSELFVEYGPEYWSCR